MAVVKLVIYRWRFFAMFFWLLDWLIAVIMYLFQSDLDKSSFSCETLSHTRSLSRNTAALAPVLVSGRGSGIWSERSGFTCLAHVHGIRGSFTQAPIVVYFAGSLGVCGSHRAWLWAVFQWTSRTDTHANAWRDIPMLREVSVIGRGQYHIGCAAYIVHILWWSR